eukprot:TRINITY_DN30134_c0_g1_i3.p3 TRINITY_DN30134_c0_g1~~TRINITY_DN30134_c0_g1_i3.p3  ORF type:complete len:104 (-),score=10.37 TRINITY_DN30134_c0_g1_i3:281-592(-)
MECAADTLHPVCLPRDGKGGAEEGHSFGGLCTDRVCAYAGLVHRNHVSLHTVPPVTINTNTGRVSLAFSFFGDATKHHQSWSNGVFALKLSVHDCHSPALQSE